MKVSELIEVLKTMPQDAEVNVEDLSDWGGDNTLEPNMVVLTGEDEYRNPRVVRIRAA
jgi:hypothetical protein